MISGSMPVVSASPAADAEELAVAAVEDETIFHVNFPLMVGQAIGSEVAAETNNMALMKAPAKAVAVSRMVEIESQHCLPFAYLRAHDVDPPDRQCTGRAKLGIWQFFQ